MSAFNSGSMSSFPALLALALSLTTPSSAKGAVDSPSLLQSGTFASAGTCGATPLAPKCNTPKCTNGDWVFWPLAQGTFCQLPGGAAGSCDGGILGPPGQVEPDQQGSCVVTPVECPDTANTPVVTVHDVYQLYCEVTKPFPNRTIIVANDIDLDTYARRGLHTLRNLPLAENVTLRGSRSGLIEGPMIYTSSAHPGDGGPLFNLENRGSRVTGIRFRGPSDTVQAGNMALVAGIVVRAPGVTIDNNEFFNFPLAGVEVRDDRGSTPDGLITESNAPIISGNFFHHNQIWGAGYGVVSSAGAYAKIISNLFNHHRHAVASDGADKTGYIAYWNFVLPETDPYTQHGCCGLVDHWQQHFDVHGQGAPGDSPEQLGHHVGGRAGEKYVIRYNTIRGAQDSRVLPVRKAFLLRGTPSISATFSNNVVEHADLNAAFSTDCGNDANCNPRVVTALEDNTFDTDTSFNLAVGDFDGDNRADVFQATGVSWWVSLGGQTEWKMLNESPAGAEGLRADKLGFADIDNDGKTDVLARANNGNLIYFSTGKLHPRILTTSPVAASDLRYGDFDNDGKTDIFRREASGAWNIWFGSTLAWRETQSSGIPLTGYRFGDFDGDGQTDLLAVTNGRWSISRGASTPWQNHGPQHLNRLDSTVAGDFNGDGITDIAWKSGNGWYYAASGKSAPVLLKSGVDSMPALSSFKIGDFNNDGADEFLHYQFVSFPALQFDKHLVSFNALSFAPTYSRYEMR